MKASTGKMLVAALRMVYAKEDRPLTAADRAVVREALKAFEADRAEKIAKEIASKNRPSCSICVHRSECWPKGNWPSGSACTIRFRPEGGDS